MEIDRKSASRMLKSIAELTELAGGNPHRVRAFSNAARAVERIEGNLAELVRDGRILEVKGIGKGTAGVLADLLAGRTPEALSVLEEEVPSGVRELLGVAGLGPKRARTLWQELGVGSVGELEYACRENRLVELPGFGPASQQRLLDAVLFQVASRERRLIHRAWQAADEVGRRLTAAGAVRVEPAGELRRGCDTVGTVEVVAVGDAGRIGGVVGGVLAGAEEDGDGRWSGVLDGAVPVRIWVTAPERAAWTLVLATGSAAHVEALRRRAAAAGLAVEAGDPSTRSAAPTFADEEALYAALGCTWVPPELREAGRELELAAAGQLPDLVKLADLRGALHNHTTDSDGVASVAEMAAAAAALGWRFLGIADHSPAAHYAGGLSADRLRAQWRAIDEVNGRGGGPRVLKGIEADILPDGSLDVPPGCEDGLDYVVASVHSSFRLSRDAQTERLLSAVRHPACRILGHPTGRLLLARPGYEVDLDRVLEACAERGVAVEINASPYRLDLDSAWARRAIELGLLLAVNPDAHDTEGLADVRWGVAVARRAGAEARHLLNCGDIEAWVARRG